MDEPPASEPATDRVRLATLIARARWISIAFGAVEAAISQPPPISRAGLLAGLAISCAYNIPASRPHRFSERYLERLLLAALCLDFLVITNAVLLSANQRLDDGYLLWVLVGLEAALLYQARGAALFCLAFLPAFSVWVVERRLAFSAPTSVGSYIFGAATMVLVALVSGGMAAIATRSAELAQRQREQTRRQADELARLYAEVRDDNQNLTGFLHSLVHEMRSPLTVIAGYADMLRLDDFFQDERGRRTAIEAVVTKAEALNEIIEELLITARIEEGRLEVQAQDLDLRSAVDEAVARISGRAGLTGATVRVSAANAPLPAAGDPRAVERILDNLLNNAINYGGDHPQVEVSAGNDGAAWVRVRDHGVGIAEPMRQRIFERFVRVREDTRHRGTGLGLFMARGLARQQQGDLELEWSEPGEGSVFLLRLPTPKPDPDKAATPRASAAPTERADAAASAGDRV